MNNRSKKTFFYYIFLFFLVILNIFFILSFINYSIEDPSWFYETTEQPLCSWYKRLGTASISLLFYFFADASYVWLVVCMSSFFYFIENKKIRVVCKALFISCPAVIILTSLWCAENKFSFYELTVPGGFVGQQVLQVLLRSIDKELVPFFIQACGWALAIYFITPFIVTLFFVHKISRWCRTLNYEVRHAFFEVKRRIIEYLFCRTT